MIKRGHVFVFFALLAIGLYVKSFFQEHFIGPSKPYMPYDPKALALNPFGNVSQVMWTLQSPKDCEAERQAVFNNPLGATQEDIDALYNCRYNAYDRMQIRNLPFGKGTSA